MTVKDIDVNETIASARSMLKKYESIAPEFKAMVELLILVITLMAGKLQTNSGNSSIPSSKNPLDAKKRNKSKAKGVKSRSSGAQVGHKGANLKPVHSPDKIEEILIDRRTLPTGNYRSDGFETRQVFNVKISTEVTEYRAEVLVDDNGQRFVANFPSEVSSYTQYGGSVKAQSVYMSIWQLVPLMRVCDFFQSQFGMSVSKGSISNFNKSAYQKLEGFEHWAKNQLIDAAVNNADETGINVGGKNHWLHSISNQKVALFHPDEKRGKEAMVRMGVLEKYKGKLVHDHWKPYYSFDLVHCLCNAHHLRELTWAVEVEEQKWAQKMHDFLVKLNKSTDKSGGSIKPSEFQKYQKKYRAILKSGEKECPLLEQISGQRGRTKQSKSRNLLSRLKDFESDVLRFAQDKEVPFTNNSGENDIRMTKVQQKVSGCFRSLEGAKIFCRIRSFMLTCQKQGYNPFTSLEDLFQGKNPEFMT